MANPPISLDNLISFVRVMNPDGGPLDNLADAMAAAGQLEVQSDALIGYFEDQAGRSGASWSQIGASMGVSKQAAQQRFVARWESAGGDADAAALRQLRFTDAGRAALRETVKAALRLGHNYVGTEHLLLGILLADGDAARAVTGLGLTAERAERALAAEFAAT